MSKYKHIKSGIVVTPNLSGFYIDRCNNVFPAIIVEDSQDWEKVVEIPQEMKDKLMAFYYNHDICRADNAMAVTIKQFKDYFGI